MDFLSSDLLKRGLLSFIIYYYLLYLYVIKTGFSLSNKPSTKLSKSFVIINLNWLNKGYLSL